MNKNAKATMIPLSGNATNTVDATADMDSAINTATVETSNVNGLKKEAMDTVKAVTTEVYKDVVSPTAKAVGSILALPFQAIDAALAKPKLWIAERQYNYEKTRQLLAEKLQNTAPEKIVAPEAYVAVPAIQNISYCMDNDELREMYANLLAKAMIDVVKDGVHPAYVEIIKQLNPDEAKVLRYMYAQKLKLPIITMMFLNEKKDGLTIIRNFSDVGTYANCEYPNDISVYFDNLCRLGLIDIATERYLANESLYEQLYSHPYILAAQKIQHEDYPYLSFAWGRVKLTDFGNAFGNICLTEPS